MGGLDSVGREGVCGRGDAVAVAGAVAVAVAGAGTGGE